MQMADAIYTNNSTNKLLVMSSNLLFAIDKTTEEVIVSDSPKGSNKILFIERIKRNENEILFNSVELLTSITNASKFDISVFKAMDKVCQLIYDDYKKGK